MDWHAHRSRLGFGNPSRSSDRIGSRIFYRHRYPLSWSIEIPLRQSPLQETAMSVSRLPDHYTNFQNRPTSITSTTMNKRSWSAKPRLLSRVNIISEYTAYYKWIVFIDSTIKFNRSFAMGIREKLLVNVMGYALYCSRRLKTPSVKA